MTLKALNKRIWQEELLEPYENQQLPLQSMYCETGNVSMKKSVGFIAIVLGVILYAFLLYMVMFPTDADAREVLPQLHTDMAWTGQKLPETIHIDHVEMKKGDIFDWHENRQMTCAILLEGELEISVLDGEVAIFRRDEAFCAPMGVLYRTMATQYTVYKRIAINP